MGGGGFFSLTEERLSLTPSTALWRNRSEQSFLSLSLRSLLHTERRKRPEAGVGDWQNVRRRGRRGGGSARWEPNRRAPATSMAEGQQGPLTPTAPCRPPDEERDISMGALPSELMRENPERRHAQDGDGHDHFTSCHGKCAPLQCKPNRTNGSIREHRNHFPLFCPNDTRHTVCSYTVASTVL